MNTFKVEDLVKMKNVDSQYGKIIYCYNDGFVAIEWISGYISKMSIDEITHCGGELKKEFANLQKKIDETYQSLYDLNAMCDSLNASIIDLVNDRHVNCKDLYDELRKTGWLPSSNDC